MELNNNSSGIKGFRLSGKLHDHGVVCISKVSQELFRKAHRLAQFDVDVLLLGETGTGKEIVANFIHQNSTRKRAPFTPVNCGGITESLLESHLFGHIKGIGSGLQSHEGYVQEVGKGTLFLDEIGDLSSKGQTSMLRFLQERKFRKVGGKTEIPFEGRIISATNKDIHKMMSDGTFREDFYH